MQELETETRDGFSFRGGHVALDLCATLIGRTKPTPRDLLETPRDLGRWLRAAQLARTSVPATDDDLADARRLREAIYAAAIARIGGESAPASARSVLNNMAAENAATPRLGEDGGMRFKGGARELLATVAQDAVRLLGGAHAARIRQCDGATCSRLFIDNSRGGDRRWCSMSACGNRAKVAEFRRRQSAGS
ncbi:MAG TPA: ABATE domain-containing protein [Caulobacterales bacterium]|nr:ABATE domain-containing protein [Caulobacterales bacterium]